ncbi:MAG: hypothetical protein OEX08_02625 [Candidatus Nomurabacteria bacterium]|nr:hypothetical protein [Candidatus Nomurabacteria bacterium]
MLPTDSISDHFRLDFKQVPALKRLRLNTIRDLLYHFPVRYGDVSSVVAIAGANDGDIVTLHG